MRFYEPIEMKSEIKRTSEMKRTKLVLITAFMLAGPACSTMAASNLLEKQILKLHGTEKSGAYVEVLIPLISLCGYCNE